MTRYKVLLALFIIFSMALSGCGGGGGSGGDDDNVASSSDSAQLPLKFLPANYDFGVVTDRNFAETLEVTIQNTGAADISVSNIALTDTNNFDLNVNAGATPCASTTPIIPVGGSCTVTVDFTPTSFDAFSAYLTVHSNDPDLPGKGMGLTGSKQDIATLDVKINQIDACLRPGTPATVYVSVIDQGGFPVTGLSSSDFTIYEAGDNGASGAGDVATNEITAVEVNGQYPISVALAMDYSGSIVNEPDNVADMENAVINLVNALGVNDEAEIIKFATEVETTQSFTSDKALLTTAIQSTPNIGDDQTKLYDAVVKAIDDTGGRTKERNAVVVITDGRDSDGAGGSISVNSLDDVIADANAKGIPVFTVGLGDADATSLQRIASETGGTYYDATTSDNLIQTYKQLAALLYDNQYVLTYPSGLASTATGNLTVTATYGSATGSDTRTISACQ
jgi:Ca-activated chloride channel family protein